jgi:two-component system chemotaxis response regulator CheB
MTQSSRKIRVLVVDDSAYNRQTIKSMLESDPVVEVVGIASDGLDAMSKTMRLKPDLITLDFEMPEMDGFGFLRWLMNERPTPVIMVSSYADKRIAFKALELGAIDFIAKPTRRASEELKTIEKDLLAKVRSVPDLNMDVIKRNLSGEDGQERRSEKAVTQVDVLAIGSSTGGPTALQKILTRLPADLPTCVLISQHMPKGFTRPLAERLNRICGLRITEAEDGDALQKGSVYICPGGSHMRLVRSGQETRIALVEARDEDKYIPSVDMMMASVVEHYSHRVMGVVLTGMGNDGLEGARHIKDASGIMIAESEESCVVYGMPKEVARAGLADKVLPVDDIAGYIIRMLMGERRG